MRKIRTATAVSAVPAWLVQWVQVSSLVTADVATSNFRGAERNAIWTVGLTLFGKLRVGHTGYDNPGNSFLWIRTIPDPTSGSNFVLPLFKQFA
jgi:hypothetical protein